VTERAMLTAFEGWNDAADAASGAIEHLEREWGAKPFAGWSATWMRTRSWAPTMRSLP